MKYLITNKDCKIYRDLFKIRSKEKKYDEENLKYITSVVGLKFKSSIGYAGQNNHYRVNNHTAFEFEDLSKVDLKVWKVFDNDGKYYVPNRKTKLGRVMHNKIAEGYKCCSHVNILDVLQVPIVGNYKVPFVEIVDDCILIELDDRQIPPDKNVYKISDNLFNGYFFKIKQIPNYEGF